MSGAAPDTPHPDLLRRNRRNIAVDLKQIMEVYWSTPAQRTCPGCGTVMQHPGEAQPLTA